MPLQPAPSFTGALVGAENAPATHTAVAAKDSQANRSEGIYVRFDPDFTVNVPDKSRGRFLQIALVAVALLTADARPKRSDADGVLGPFRSYDSPDSPAAEPLEYA
ncbi:MAG: hypothetical protein ACREXS_13055 [Gammaproteobacteria bacterium]